MTTRPTIHASAVLVGARAVLIRGPSGAGKSRLALALLHTEQSGQSVFTRLVSDDRSHLEAHHGRLLVRAPANLAGLIEVRGLGIRRLHCEPVAVVGLVVDLAAPDGDRYPAPASRQTTVEGIVLSRLAIAADVEPLRIVLAALSNPRGSADG